MKRVFAISTTVLLAGLFGMPPLEAASPSSGAAPEEQIAPAAGRTPASNKNVAPVHHEEVPSPKRSFLAPVGDFARDSILRPQAPFELVPGKDPNGWGFVLEPYAWAMGLDGDVDIRRLPTMNVNVDARKLLQSLDWAIFARGEIRKGRWGLLADGFYAELSASGDLGGVFYKSGSLNLQQGLASLALAYRIIDDRRGFLDFYAGARYNYLGVSVEADIDEEGIQQVGNNITERLASQVNARVQSAVSAELQSAQAQLARDRALLQQEVRAAEDLAQERIQAEENLVQEEARAEQAVLREDVRGRIAATLESDLQARLRRDLAGNRPVRDSFRDAEILGITKGVRSELRALLNAVLDARLAEGRAVVDAQLAEARAAARARLAADRSRIDAQLAADRSRIDARLAQAKANAQARVAQAEKKLSKAIAQRIEDALPTSGSGDVWWFDPILGLRGQINLTRWLFLAAQGDVGGFGAGSQIAWNVQATLGFNFTRNIFAEFGYRYMYIDYDKNNLLYQMNSFGLFSGIGVKF